MDPAYQEQFKWALEHRPRAKYIVWTPDGMTQEDALRLLPPACHRHLMLRPCAYQVEWLGDLCRANILAGNFRVAGLIMRCITKADRMIAEAREVEGNHVI
jgi:hypothetical protein